MKKKKRKERRRRRTDERRRQVFAAASRRLAAASHLGVLLLLPPLLKLVVIGIAGVFSVEAFQGIYCVYTYTRLHRGVVVGATADTKSPVLLFQQFSRIFLLPGVWISDPRTRLEFLRTVITLVCPTLRNYKMISVDNHSGHSAIKKFLPHFKLEIEQPVSVEIVNNCWIYTLLMRR